MVVRVFLKETAQSIDHTKVVNTYTKGPMYCVYADGQVYKYPLANIFRVVETY